MMNRSSVESTVPLISCIMPTYNRREFVPRAIRLLPAAGLRAEGTDHRRRRHRPDRRSRPARRSHSLSSLEREDLRRSEAQSGVRGRARRDHRALGRRRLARAAAPALSDRSAAARTRRRVRHQSLAVLRCDQRSRVAVCLSRPAALLAVRQFAAATPDRSGQPIGLPILTWGKMRALCGAASGRA